VRRWPKDRHREAKAALEAAPFPSTRPAELRLVAIGASTGGPMALQLLLSHLPANFSIPIVVVQHMAQGFVQGFVEWLAGVTGRRILVGSHGQRILEGYTYVAPDHFHMGVTSDGRISLSRCERDNGLCPAVSRLFHSAADAYGKGAVGVLLTGMGKDGAAELKRMQEKGAVTFVQDGESAVIHGMPGEAIRLGAASYILPPERIAATLAELVQKSQKK
jgi:two-component system, chemotaxis family, protein-glutamate methylesterase/glutaminase